ncbi:MAG: hypothetical protein J2P21_11695 [Chloracidobacterium sp.]|nr:hypothetical protein [Chloracidobacterium sp.]
MLARVCLSLAGIVICAVTGAFAQSISYLDPNYNPASEKSYAFKRVIKYKNPVAITHIGRDYYGNWTSHSELTGLHVCSLTDYFPGGEVALVANVISNEMTCAHWNFDGKVVYYYRSGHIRKTESYKVAKLQGDVITYAEDGREVTKEHYEGGQLIDNKKYAVAPNNPLVGKWKYVRRWDKAYCVIGPCVQSTLECAFSSSGINYTQYRDSQSNWDSQVNWKYISTGSATGVLEGYQGELISRGDVRWINRNEFDFTYTFSTDANSIGQKMRFVRE